MTIDWQYEAKLRRIREDQWRPGPPDSPEAVGRQRDIVLAREMLAQAQDAHQAALRSVAGAEDNLIRARLAVGRAEASVLERKAELERWAAQVARRQREYLALAEPGRAEEEGNGVA